MKNIQNMTTYRQRRQASSPPMNFNKSTKFLADPCEEEAREELPAAPPAWSRPTSKTSAAAWVQVADSTSTKI